MNSDAHEPITRRSFTKDALGSLLAFSLVDTLCRYDLFAAEVKPITVKWLKQLNDLSSELKKKKAKQLDWQKSVEDLFKRVDLPDLLQAIDFAKLEKNAE